MSEFCKNWSDGKKWFMGILAALVISGIGFVSSSISKSKEPIYLSPQEIEVHNEWVATIAYGNSEKNTKAQMDEFISLYKKSGHDTWLNNILVVRHPKTKGVWMLVIDTFHNRSTKELVDFGISNMKDFANSSREKQDTFGSWLNGAEAFDWRLKDFTKTYGVPVNMPTGNKLRIIDE